MNDEILEELRNIWYNHPEWRFGQLIYNILYSVPSTKKSGRFIDPFFLDDKELLKYLKMIRGGFK